VIFELPAVFPWFKHGDDEDDDTTVIYDEATITASPITCCSRMGS